MVLHSAKAVQTMLEGLTRVNVDELRANPNLPDLYKCGVRYQREPDGVNRWLTYVEVLARKVADCEDLACARAALLRVRYGEPGAHVSVKFVHQGLWHVRVVRQNGQIEDPSRILGMGGAG